MNVYIFMFNVFFFQRVNVALALKSLPYFGEDSNGGLFGLNATSATIISHWLIMALAQHFSTVVGALRTTTKCTGERQRLPCSPLARSDHSAVTPVFVLIACLWFWKKHGGKGMLAAIYTTKMSVSLEVLLRHPVEKALKAGLSTVGLSHANGEPLAHC